MHPQDFRSIADHLYDAYCTLHEEIHRLRKENKVQTEELNKLKTLNTALTAKLSNLNTARILKMGAEWFLDGEFLLNLSLIKRIKFNSPICNSKITKKGKIAITCNNKIFLLIDKNIFLVEETIEPVDPKNMKTELVDLERRIFDFIGEDLVVYHNGSIIKFNEQEKEWMLDINNVRHISIDQELIYIGVAEGYIHIYNKDGVFVRSMEVNRGFTSFIARDSEVLLALHDGVTLLPSFSHNCSHRIIASEFDGKTVYYGGNAGIVHLSLPSGNSLQPYDTLGYKSMILSLMKYKNFLFVATEDKTVNAIDLETKKCMRIVLTDNIVDMCCNERCICFVDNNGGLREWEVEDIH